jgi:hypothetical protein
MGLVMTKQQTMDFAGILHKETDRAYLVQFGTDEPVWLPKSQVEMFDDANGPIFTIPFWLAREKGIL